jgi:hypothetical protein
MQWFALDEQSTLSGLLMFCCYFVITLMKQMEKTTLVYSVFFSKNLLLLQNLSLKRKKIQQGVK